MELHGKRVLLTGATGGLGRAIAATLAERGAILVLSSRREAELRELAAALPGDGHEPVVADLALEGAARALAEDVGAIDALVANAGLPASGRLEGFSPDALDRALRVNLESPLQMSHALLPAMRERGSGHLVFISSLAGKAAAPRSSVYSATKFGVRGFALCLRQDLRGTGIGVSVVLPGFVRDAGMFADSGSKSPPGLGTAAPHEVGEAVAVAIERNRPELEVAPFAQRVAAGFAHRRPHLAARLSAPAAGKVADRVADGQTDKR